MFKKLAILLKVIGWSILLVIVMTFLSVVSFIVTVLTPAILVSFVAWCAYKIGTVDTDSNDDTSGSGPGE